MAKKRGKQKAPPAVTDDDDDDNYNESRKNNHNDVVLAPSSSRPEHTSVKDTKNTVTNHNKPPIHNSNNKDTFWAVLWLFGKFSLLYALAWGLCGVVAGYLVCSSDEGRAVLMGLCISVLCPTGCAIGFLKATRRGWLQLDDDATAAAADRNNNNYSSTGIVRRRVRARIARWLKRHHRWEEAAELVAHKFPVVVESMLSERSYTVCKWVLPFFLPSAKAVFQQLDKFKHHQHPPQPHMQKLAGTSKKQRNSNKRDMAETLTSAVSDLCDAHVERWEFRLTVLGVVFFAASACLGGVVDSALVDDAP